jgi:Enterobacteriaceae phage exonuclease
MKTLSQINSLLEAFEKQYNIPATTAMQGTSDWLQLKLGVISASNASKLVAKKDSETRNTYMCELVAQVCTGTIEELNFKQLEWGKFHEDAARSTYEFATDNHMSQVCFVFKDETFRSGSSPDGIINSQKGAEIKCPWDSTNYIKFFVSDRIKTEWSWQNQFNMWITGATEWDFVQYDPRMKKSPIKILTIERDEKAQATLEDAVPQFISDMDKMLDQIGIKFGDQWMRIGATKNIESKEENKQVG